MRTIILDATTKKITAELSGAAATTNPDFVTSYADDTGSAFTEGVNDGALNGTMPVDIVASPASSTRRLIKSIDICNKDTAPVTLILKYNNNGTLRTFVKVILQINDTFTLEGVFDGNGNLKTYGGYGYSPVNKAGDTMTGDLNVPDEAYASAWNGSLEVPTKNAIWDQNFQNLDIFRIYTALGSAIKASVLGVGLDRVTGILNLGTGTPRFTAIWIQQAMTITGVKWFQNTIGNYTADQNNYVALYSYSGGTLTQVAISTNNGNIWKTAASGTFGSEAFSSTYAAQPGLYFVACLYHASAQTTAPSLATIANMAVSNITKGDFTNSAKFNFTLSAQTTLATPITISTGAADLATVWFSLY